jgi:hypothetical protein
MTITFPMTDLLVTPNVRMKLALGPGVSDLSSAVLCTQAKDLLFRLSQRSFFPKVAILYLLRVEMLVKRLMAHWFSACDLLGAQLQLQQRTCLFLYQGYHRVHIATL